MKTCPNCRAIYADEYAGQCSDCGRPMGTVEANGSSDLSFAFARQVQAAREEDNYERQVKNARSPRAQADVYDRAKLPSSIVDVARGFITVDPEKLKEAEDAA